MSHQKVDVNTSVAADGSVTVHMKVDGHKAEATFADGQITLSVPWAEGTIGFTVPESLSAGR